MTSDRPYRATLLAFAGLGITASLIPATLPLLSAEIEVPTQELVPALPALFGGLLFGVLLAPVAALWRPVLAVVRLGILVQAAGFVVLGTAALPLTVMLGALLCGVGFGLTESSGAVTARSSVTGATGRNLTGLTIAVAAAGATAPLLVVVAGTPDTVRFVLVSAAAFHLATLLLLARHRATSTVSAGPANIAVGFARVPALRRAAGARDRTGVALSGVTMTGAALFCFVGVEALLSGWSAVLVEREIGADAAAAAVGTSAFWTLAGLGRLTAWLLTPRMLSNRQLTVTCAALIMVSLGASVILLDSAPALALALLGVTVLACGPCYGLLLGDAVERASERSAPVVSAALVALGAVGGTLLPLAAAFSPDAFGGRSSVIIAALGAALLTVLVLALARHTHTRISEGVAGG